MYHWVSVSADCVDTGHCADWLDIYTLLYSGPVSPITHSDPATRYKPASTIYSTFYNDSATEKLIDTLHIILAAQCLFLKCCTVLIIDRHIVKSLVGMLLLHEVVENVPEQNLVAGDLAVQERHLYVVDTV